MRDGPDIPRLLRRCVATLAVGAAAAAFAVAFRLALHGALRALFGSNDILEGFAALPPAARVAAPMLGGLLAGSLASAVARQEGGHQFADILEKVALGKGDLSLPRVLVKALASFCAQVGGASIGREGPILQFGAAFGSAVGRRLDLNDADARVLVAAGTAAGFAAAYNTPIAAVLFVLELLVGVMSLEVVLPVSVAVAVATLVARGAIGPGPLYGERTFALHTWLELPAHATLGLLAGVVGAGLVPSLALAERLVLRIGLRRPVRAALGGALVGLVALGVPAVAGNGYEAIQTVLDGRTTGLVLFAWFAAKAFATTATVGTGSPGGVFTPSMFLGATLGGFLGGFVPYAGASGAYALVGMAAMAAATTQAPVMATILVFELSGDYEIVLPLVIATGIAAVVSRALHPETVYTAELARRGVAWTGTLSDRLSRSIHGRDLLGPPPATIAPDAPLEAVLAHFERGTRVLYLEGPDEPGDNGPVRRAIDLRAVWHARDAAEAGADLTAADLAKPVPIARKDDALPDLADQLWALDRGEMPVVEEGRIIGVITRRHLLRAFDHELLARAALITRTVGDPAASQAVELPKGLGVAWVSVPPPEVGRPLDVAGFYDRYDAHAVATRTLRTWLAGRRAAAPGDRPLRAGDQVLVVGSPRAIAALGDAPAAVDAVG